MPGMHHHEIRRGHMAGGAGGALALQRMKMVLLGIVFFRPLCIADKPGFPGHAVSDCAAHDQFTARDAFVEHLALQEGGVFKVLLLYLAIRIIQMLRQQRREDGYP